MPDAGDESGVSGARMEQLRPAQCSGRRCRVEHRDAVWWVVLTVALAPLGCRPAGSAAGRRVCRWDRDRGDVPWLRRGDVSGCSLAVAWGKAAAGSDCRGRSWWSLLLYLAYTYACYYLFGTGFNDLLGSRLFSAWPACWPRSCPGDPRHARLAAGFRVLTPASGRRYRARGAGRRAGGRRCCTGRRLPGHGIVADG